MKRENKDERLKQTKGKEEFIKIEGKNLILVASSTIEQVRKCRRNVTIRRVSASKQLHTQIPV
jgi:hypothetical protein